MTSDPDKLQRRGPRVRLIACDLDGTLLAPDGRMSARTIAAVRAAHDAGIRVVAATGRSTPSAVPRNRPAPPIDTAVCSHGLLVPDVGSGQTTDPLRPDPTHAARAVAVVAAAAAGV